MPVTTVNGSISAAYLKDPASPTWDNDATVNQYKSLMAKYARSGANFARMAERHPDAAAAMPLYKAAKTARGLPLRFVFKGLTRLLVKLPLPVALRGRARPREIGRAHV